MLEIKKLDQKTILIIFNTKTEMFDYIERLIILSWYEHHKDTEFAIKPNLSVLKYWYKTNISKNNNHIINDDWIAFAIPRKSGYTKKELKDFSKRDNKLITLLSLLDTYFKNTNYMLLLFIKNFNYLTFPTMKQLILYGNIIKNIKTK